jgi:hypothetical protein
MHAAADAYLKSMPRAEDDVWPALSATVISLQLAAWRSTRGRSISTAPASSATSPLGKFFGQNPLPRASLKSDHYETLTGADTPSRSPCSNCISMSCTSPPSAARRTPSIR